MLPPDVSAARRTYVTIAERNRMRAWRREGVSEREIQRRTGRAIHTIRHHVGDIPSTARPGRKTILTPEKRAALLRDADDGWSYHMTAPRYGVARSTAISVVCVMRRERRQAAAAQAEARP